MFRMLETGLPKDPVFPTDLKGLGYFVNDEDEIRNIQDPKSYFKYFLTKNDRYNAVQREAMNEAIRKIVMKRLLQCGLEAVRLPLGTAAESPHVPILVSSDLMERDRVVILFYEHTQDLGILAHRVIGGKGGIDQGSAVNFVKYLNACSLTDNGKPSGIILANMGQLRWSRRFRKALTQLSWYNLPQNSAVTTLAQFDEIDNTVPRNRSTAEHVRYVLTEVVTALTNPNAKLQIIGVSDGAVQVVEFLNKANHWIGIRDRMEALALLAPFFHQDCITNEDFAAWLKNRGRAFAVSTHPAGVPIADSTVGKYRTGFGCPTYSLGEPYYSELMLPKGYKIIVDWFCKVANDPAYENEEVVVYHFDGDEDEEDGAMEDDVQSIGD